MRGSPSAKLNWSDRNPTDVSFFARSKSSGNRARYRVFPWGCVREAGARFSAGSLRKRKSSLMKPAGKSIHGAWPGE